MEIIYDIQMTSLAILVLAAILRHFDAGVDLWKWLQTIITYGCVAAIPAGFLSTMYFIWMT